MLKNKVRAADMKDIHSESVDRLFDAFLMLKTREDCYDFFEDICTMKEIEDMAKRLETAILLDEGVNYRDICEKAGVSTATISRVSRCLNYGTGGYRKILDNLKQKEE